MKQAKGYFGRRKNVYTVAKNAVEKAMLYAYRDRRQKKRNFRTLWITRINAALMPTSLSYSTFIHGLNKAGISINRKMLSEMAIHDPQAFAKLVEQAEQALG